MTMSLHAPSPLEVEDPDRRLILSDLLRLVSPGEAEAEEALRTTFSSSAPSDLVEVEEEDPSLTFSGLLQAASPGEAVVEEVLKMTTSLNAPFQESAAEAHPAVATRNLFDLVLSQ
jgi:hypothetical protein